MERMESATRMVKDVSPHEFVKAYAAHLKRSGKAMEVEQPQDVKEDEEGEELVDGVRDEEKESGVEALSLLRFDFPPRRLYHFNHQFRRSDNNNFLKGVKWSPDGSCFLTSSDDNTLRLFCFPETTCPVERDAAVDEEDSYAANIIVSEAEPVYDFCWYPYMSVSDPTTCVFASTTCDHPIHLWDAITGQLRCTYRAYDAMDEITAALSVSFNSSGTKLFAGYNKAIRVFDVHRPGRDFEQYSLLKDNDGHQTTAVYAEANMEPLYVLHGQVGGVTQVLFSKDGNYLYTGGRKDPYILCWDIRNTVDIVYKLYRSSENTNQKIAFDIEPYGRHLATGGQDGLVHVYDLQSGQWVTAFQAASDTVNGFSFHPSLPLAASSSGHRRFCVADNFEENSSFRGDENCASVWMFSYSLEVESATTSKCET